MKIIEITYTCDHCKAKTGPPYGALIVDVHGEFGDTPPQQLHLCSFDCLSKWADEWALAGNFP